MSDADIDRVAAHLEGCPACEALLQDLDGRVNTVGAAFRDPATTLDATTRPVEPGA